MSSQRAEFYKNPVFIAIIISAMIMMVLGIVVVSTRLEDKLRDSENEGDAPQEHINARRAEIIISEASEEEVIITEDGNEPLSMKSYGTYLNNRVLSVAPGYGMTFTLGLEQDGLTDALYLNPHFEYAYAGNPYEAYGYLMKTERVPLECAETSASPAWSADYAGLTDFVITGRTYDRVVPATALDPNRYGVRWADSPAYGGADHAGDQMRILIIRLSDGTLMGAVKADISYDIRTRTYSLRSLMESDVASTGELSKDEREHLIQEAIQYLVQGNSQMTMNLTREELEAQKQSFIVEHPLGVYYNKLFDTDGKVVSSGAYSKCEIYAVHLNCDGFGYFTVYFAPEPQVNGLSMKTLNKGEQMKLVLFGYDAFAPFTAESFSSFLHPEDISLFTEMGD